MVQSLRHCLLEIAPIFSSEFQPIWSFCQKDYRYLWWVHLQNVLVPSWTKLKQWKQSEIVVIFIPKTKNSSMNGYTTVIHIYVFKPLAIVVRGPIYETNSIAGLAFIESFKVWLLQWFMFLFIFFPASWKYDNKWLWLSEVIKDLYYCIYQYKPAHIGFEQIIYIVLYLLCYMIILTHKGLRDLNYI